MERIRDPRTIEALRAASVADKATRDSMSQGFAHRMDGLAEENAETIRRYEEGPTGDPKRDLETAAQAVWVQAQAIILGYLELRRRQHQLRNTDDTVRGLVPKVPYPRAPIGTPEEFVQSLRSERKRAGSNWFAAGSFLAVPLEPSEPRKWFTHGGRLTFRPDLDRWPVKDAIILTPEWWDVLKAGWPELIEKSVCDLTEDFVDMEAEIEAEKDAEAEAYYASLDQEVNR